MALISVAGVPVGPPSALCAPLTGRPWAELTLSTQAAPFSAGDTVQVAVQDGPTYTMTCERVGPRGGFARARLIGGTGGLSRTIPARWYRAIPAATVAREILEAAGETVGELDLPGTLAMWVRLEGPAHEALRALMMRYTTRTWRMAPDGRVSIGAATWPEYGAPIRVEASDPAAGTFTGEFTPALQPGQHVTLTRGEEQLGKRVTRVTHAIDPTHNASRVRTVIGTGDGDDLGVAGLEASVRRAMRHTDYHALRPAQCLRDHGDHTVDVEVLEAGWPQLTRVPLDVRLPGVTLKVKVGSPLLLSFLQGDPSQPLAEPRHGAVLEYMQVKTGRGQILTLDDDRGQRSPDDSVYARPYARLEDQAGSMVELWAQPGAEKVTVTHTSGSTLVMSPTGDVLLQPAGHLMLGGPGGAALARVGDAVQVDPITHAGTITSGSAVVTST